MRIAICDDQEAIRNRLFQSIKSYFINNEITNPTITLFSDAISLLDSIKQKNFYDIIFLDIDALFILNIFKSSNDIKTCTFFNMKKESVY